MRSSLLISLLAATVLLAGCPKRDTVDETAGAGADTTDATRAGAGADGLEAGTTIDTEDGPQPAEGLLGQRIVYFDYDQAEVRAEYGDVIAAHAKNLGSNPGLRVRLEGHSDERGSREYNIGLGERRAQAVRRALMLQGAGDDQIATVSYGEERPAAAGSDESAWSQNRRVEIIYVQ